MKSEFSSINLRINTWTSRFDAVLEKNVIGVLWAIFGISILSKWFVIPFLGAASFPNSDEHIFIELAKSFFYSHDFFSNGFSYIKQYNEVLYPLILSPAYLFFSPENIISVLRSYGLLLMSAAVFPAYKLGFMVLGNKKQALLVSIIAILIPEMTLAYTVSQEVIYYPIYLFALCLIYKRISGGKVNPILLGLVFLLLWVCKAVGVTVFIAYIAYLMFEFILINKFKNPKAFFLEMAVLAMVVLGLKELITLGIRYINTGSLTAVSGFYATSLNNALKVPLSRFFSDLLNGGLYYLFYTTIAFMIVPVILPVDHFNKYLLIDRKFLIFLGICFMATLGTVVVLVYMVEGGAAREVQRVHYRYFFPLLIPLVTLLLKIDFSKLKLGIPGALLALFLLLYDLIFRPRFVSGSTIDAKSLLFLERINVGIVNGFNNVVLAMSLFLVLIGYLIYKKLDGARARKLVILILLAVTFANQAYATYKTYKYYTVQTSGIERKNEYTAMGRLVSSTQGTPIIMYPANTLWFDVLLSTQTNRDFSRIAFVENVLEYTYDPAYPPNFIITPKDLLLHSQIRNASRVNPDLRLFDMYQLNVVSDGKINLEYSLTNVYPDGYLKDNAKLFISGAGRSDQVNLTLELKTSKFAGAIFAVIKDSTGNITTALVNPDGTTLNLLVKKNPNEKDFVLTLSSNGFFVPKEMPVESGGSDDARKLTYTVSQINIK